MPAKFSHEPSTPQSPSRLHTRPSAYARNAGQVVRFGAHTNVAVPSRRVAERFATNGASPPQEERLLAFGKHTVVSGVWL